MKHANHMRRMTCLTASSHPKRGVVLRCLFVVFAVFAAATPHAQPGPASAAGADSGRPPRSVSVSGSGTVRYVPEFVDLDFSITARAKGYREAQGALMDASGKTIARLSALPWVESRDLSTLSFSLDEEWRYTGSTRVLQGYVAVNRLRLRLRSLDRYQDTMVALLDAGVNGVSGLRFGVADESGFEVEALALAMKDARRKASVLAAAAGARLGEVLSIQAESGYEPEAPRLMAMKTASVDAEPQADLIAEGERTVRAGVQASFLLE